MPVRFGPRPGRGSLIYLAPRPPGAPPPGPPVSGRVLRTVLPRNVTVGSDLTRPDRLRSETTCTSFKRPARSDGIRPGPHRPSRPIAFRARRASRTSTREAAEQWAHTPKREETALPGAGEPGTAPGHSNTWEPALCAQTTDCSIPSIVSRVPAVTTRHTLEHLRYRARASDRETVHSCPTPIPASRCPSHAAVG